MSKFPCTRCLYSGQTFKSTSSAPAESDGAPRRTWPAAWADRVSNYPSAGWCGSSDSATGFLLCCLWTAAQSSLLRLCPTFCKPEERQNKRGGHKKQTKWGVKLFTTGQWQMVKSSFKEAIDNFSCHVESDENQLSKVPLDFFFFFFFTRKFTSTAVTADTPTHKPPSIFWSSRSELGAPPGVQGLIKPAIPRSSGGSSHGFIT